MILKSPVSIRNGWYGTLFEYIDDPVDLNDDDTVDLN